MSRPGWYLIGYDITSPLRLQRIRKILGQHGLAMQRSLFLVRKSVPELAELFRILETQMTHKDDLRAWPIQAPDAIRFNRPEPVGNLPLLYL
ncbi:MAG: CRISPR-associated endonuclease Cas2 [Geobacteraceae bacterium]|nr:CRISPR-associated endonuclease Cas2 [Geobacteraceae bacterium]